MPVLRPRPTGVLVLLLVLSICAVWQSWTRRVERPEPSPSPVADIIPAATSSPIAGAVQGSSLLGITVEVSGGGCFHSHGDTLSWIAVGDEWVSEVGRLPNSEVERIRSLILASQKPCDPLHALGPMPRPDRVRERIGEIFAWVEAPLPEIDARKMHDELKAIAVGPPANQSTSWNRITIVLEGEPELALVAEQDDLEGWMLDEMYSLPKWTVTSSDGRTWKTRCTELSQGLRSLFGPDAQTLSQLDRYYDDFIFYKARLDGLAWAQPYFDAEHARWPGWAEVNECYKVRLDTTLFETDIGAQVHLEGRGKAYSGGSVPFNSRDWRPISSRLTSRGR